MTEEKTIARGYVKWTDKEGVFHKELLTDHADLLAGATPEQQLAAEEARRLNAAADEFLAAREEDNSDDVENTLQALKDAPEDVLTASELVAVTDEDGNETIVPADEAGALVDSNDLNNMSQSPELPPEVGSNEDPTDAPKPTPKPWDKKEV